MKVPLRPGRRGQHPRGSYRVAPWGASTPRPKVRRSRRSSRRRSPNRARSQYCPVRSPRRRIRSHLLHRGLTVPVRVVREKTAPTLCALPHLHLSRNQKSRSTAANGQRYCTISPRTYVPCYHILSWVLMSLVCRIQPTSVSRLGRGFSSRNETQKSGGRPRVIVSRVWSLRRTSRSFDRELASRTRRLLDHFLFSFCFSSCPS